VIVKAGHADASHHCVHHRVWMMRCSAPHVLDELLPQTHENRRRLLTQLQCENPFVNILKIFCRGQRTHSSNQFNVNIPNIGIHRSVLKSVALKIYKRIQSLAFFWDVCVSIVCEGKCASCPANTSLLLFQCLQKVSWSWF